MLLAPKASEASWGLSYFCQGVLSGYCCVYGKEVTVVCERVVTVIEFDIGGPPKCPKFIRRGHTFGGCWLLLILMMVSTQKCVQLII